MTDVFGFWAKHSWRESSAVGGGVYALDTCLEDCLWRYGSEYSEHRFLLKLSNLENDARNIQSRSAISNPQDTCPGHIHPLPRRMHDRQSVQAKCLFTSAADTSPKESSTPLVEVARSISVVSEYSEP
jgi:hypothetical protein